MKVALKSFLASFVVVLSFLFAPAAVNAASSLPKFFDNEQACLVALEKGPGSYSFYEPSVNNPAPASWTRRKATSNECRRGWTTQGWEWVVLPKGFEYAYDEVGKRWVMAKCQNPIDYEGNTPQQQVVAEVPARYLAPTCDAKCQAVKVCDEKNGSLKEIGLNNWQCMLPTQLVEIIQPVVAEGRVDPVWKGWKDPGLHVPAPPISLEMGKQRPPVVMGQMCQCQQTGRMLPVGSPTCQPFVKNFGTQTCTFNNNDLSRLADKLGSCRRAILETFPGARLP